ncbi:MAG TPA: hypothetical protein VIM70_12450 [Clostridium sp.]|uniref:hypothetical protein n=1 Tax=Clostridium sp. TaxID=1506 RepID=UPI002F92A5BF
MIETTEQDHRTLRALGSKQQNLLDGEIVKIGKNVYHINSTYLKTKQGHPVYEVMQNDKQYAYLYFVKYAEVTRKNDSWLLSYTIQY